MSCSKTLLHLPTQVLTTYRCTKLQEVHWLQFSDWLAETIMLKWGFMQNLFSTNEKENIHTRSWNQSINLFIELAVTIMTYNSVNSHPITIHKIRFLDKVLWQGEIRIEVVSGLCVLLMWYFSTLLDLASWQQMWHTLFFYLN